MIRPRGGCLTISNQHSSVSSSYVHKLQVELKGKETFGMWGKIVLIRSILSASWSFPPLPTTRAGCVVPTKAPCEHFPSVSSRAPGLEGRKKLPLLKWNVVSFLYNTISLQLSYSLWTLNYTLYLNLNTFSVLYIWGVFRCHFGWTLEAWHKLISIKA